MKRIYLDYSATTPVDPRVVEYMLPYFRLHFGNPSSTHFFGQQARMAVEEARRKLANLLQCRESEIVFTSGGTESDNLAIRGVAYACRHRGNHIITSQVEHAAVLNTCRALEKEGFQVTYLPVDAYGMVSPEILKRALKPETILVSIMHANNEVGTINPIDDLARVVTDRGIYFHTDAVQSFGKLMYNLQNQPIALLSISSHKIYGPKGVGALFIRKGTPFHPIITGGRHEQGRRAGTLNVPGIVGFAYAAELAYRELEKDRAYITQLRQHLWNLIQEKIPGVVLNGHPEKRLFHQLHISIPGCDAETLVMGLDMQGVAVSTGSACHAGSVEPSHVLKAMKIPSKLAHSAIRISLGKFVSEQDVEYTARVLSEVVSKIRHK